MKDAVLVGVGKGVGARGQHVAAFLVGQDAAFNAAQQLGQVKAVDVLHDQVGIGAVHLKVVDGHDVWVVEQAGRAGLAQSVFHGRGLDARLVCSR